MMHYVSQLNELDKQHDDLRSKYSDLMYSSQSDFEPSIDDSNFTLSQSSIHSREYVKNLQETELDLKTIWTKKKY